MAQLTMRQRRQRRHKRVRKDVFGTAERPRLVVFRSNRGISAQLIDDTAGRTLAAASSLDLKGDKRTKKGKIYRGSYGKRRPRKLKNKIKQTPPTNQKRA